MSEVFEALLKAQRDADARRQEGGTSSPSSAVDKAPAGGNGRVATTRQPPRPPRRSFRWRVWARNGIKRNGHGYEIPWLIAPDRGTVVAEQFRVLRTRIETVGPSALMLTSALDQEGKTLCAVNLSIALAMGVGGGAILVDADLRRPSAGALFAGRDQPGLLDCLTGDARWQDCLVATSYPGLKVLPAGRPTSVAADLLASERMQSVVTELRAEYPQHRILFDTPPVLLTADPIALAPLMDHIVLVVRAGVTPRRAVSKAIEALGAEKFLGVILNDATDHLSDHYYYGGRYAYGDPPPAHD